MSSKHQRSPSSSEEPSVVSASESPQAAAIRTQFLAYQQEIDARNDKYERVVKLSRDIVIESKRVIFQLHRVNTDGTTVAEAAGERLRMIRGTKFREIARELQNEDIYAFLKSFSFGLQEYMEAVLFQHFICSRQLLHLDEICSTLKFEGQAVECSEKHCPNSVSVSASGGSQKAENHLSIIIPVTEYLLSVGDLTGELMRLAINCISAGKPKETKEICEFMADVYSGMASFQSKIHLKEFTTKLRTLKQSLDKVEKACYVIQLRGTEVPQHLLVDIAGRLFSDAAPEHREEMHSAYSYGGDFS